MNFKEVEGEGEGGSRLCAGQGLESDECWKVGWGVRLGVVKPCM